MTKKGIGKGRKDLTNGQVYSYSIDVKLYAIFVLCKFNIDGIHAFVKFLPICFDGIN